MKIQVLGPGCPKCRQLAANVERAVRELGLAAEVEKVTDIREIMKFGLLTTPGLAVEGELKSYGKVLSVEEIKRILA
jgi:small redox-active disulfide protein 2